MAVAPKPRSTFGDQLRHELYRQGLSLRKLSRRLDAENPERARRNLSRWVAGHHRPSAANRALIADALGVPREQFADADDEEEDQEMADLVHALMRRIDQRVAEGIAAALDKQKPAAATPQARDGLQTTEV
jgi:transcriptional regulator with XRE-family HTH domain